MSLRANGSYIGPRLSDVSQSAAGGVWAARDVDRYTRQGVWPAAPGVASGLAVDSVGDQTIDLSWTAPASGNVTDYLVEYTPSGGSASVQSVGSSSTSYQLTGLTSGTNYSVRVAASNAGLVGAYTSAVTGTPTAAATDPDFSSVQLLMHMDGSNGSTTFTDDSQNGLTVTAYGNAAVSTAQAKFGQSAAFDGSTDYLVVTDTSSVTAAGTGDFTYECWFYNPSGSNTASNSGTLFQGGTGSPILRYASGNLSFGIVGVGYLITATWPTDGQWHHVAVCRDSTSTRLYVDGAEESSGTVTNSLTAITHFGAHTNTALAWDGYIDDVRITIGLARYTGSSYTVPTAAFPDQ